MGNRAIFVLLNLVMFSFTNGFKAFGEVVGDPVKGKDLYQKCAACHGGDGLGKKSQQAPMLAGQYDWYVVNQIKAIQSKERSNANANKMYPFVKALSEQDINDLASYIQSLKKR